MVSEIRGTSPEQRRDEESSDVGGRSKRGVVAERDLAGAVLSIITNLSCPFWVNFWAPPCLPIARCWTPCGSWSQQSKRGLLNFLGTPSRQASANPTADPEVVSNLRLPCPSSNSIRIQRNFLHPAKLVKCSEGKRNERQESKQSKTSLLALSDPTRTMAMCQGQFRRFHEGDKARNPSRPSHTRPHKRTQKKQQQERRRETSLRKPVCPARYTSHGGR